MMKPKLNQILTALTFTLVCVANSALAQYAGTFGYGLELNGTGAGAINSGITTLYALNNGGGTRLTPLGSSATLNQSSWANGTPSSPVLNLGTFNPGAGDTLTLLGGAMLSYQGGGATVGSAVYINYAIDAVGGPFAQWAGNGLLALNESNVNGATGDMRWSNESLNVNLLTGLAPGTYVLESYGYANSTVGDQYVSNGGGNYGATFTVSAVPEPSTLALAGLAGVAMTFLFRRRKV